MELFVVTTALLMGIAIAMPAAEKASELSRLKSKLTARYVTARVQF